MVLNTEWAQVEVIDLINDGSGLAFGIIGGRSTGVVVKTILPGGVADRDGRLQSGDHILQIGEVNLRGLGSEQVASVLRQCGVHVRMVVARPVESTTADYQALGSHAPIVPTKILGDPVELDRYLIENGYTETFTQPPSNYSTPFIYTGQQSDIQLHPISGIVDVVKDPLPIGNVPLPPQQIDVQPNVPKMLPLDMALHQPDLPETEIYTVKLKKDDLGLGITVAGYVCEKEEISGIFVKSISKGSAADLTKNIKINDRIIEVDGVSVVGCTNHQAVELLRNTGPLVTITVERYLRGPKYEQLQQAIRANELRPPSPPSPSISSLQKIPLSLVHMSYLGIEPEGESRTSVDFDSTILLDASTPINEEQEIVIDGRRSLQFSIASQESIYDKWREKLDKEVEIVIAEMYKEFNSGLGISLEGTVDVEDGKEVRPHHYIRNILPDGPVGKNGILQSGDELLEVNGIQLLGLNHLEVVSILKQLPNFVCIVCARYLVPIRIIDTSQHREAFQARKILAGSLQTLIPSNENQLVKAKSETSITSSITSGAHTASRSRSLELIAGLPMWSEEPTVIELNKGDHGLGFSILDYQDPLNPQETVIVIRSLVPGGVAQADGHLIPGDRLLAVNDINVEHATLDRAVQVLKGAPRGIVKITVAKPLTSNDAVSHTSQFIRQLIEEWSEDVGFLQWDTEDDQTCFEDFQECLEEYQECLEVVHICIDEDTPFNNSPCTSQVEDFGQNTTIVDDAHETITNSDFLDNNYLVVTKLKTTRESIGDSDIDISFKSTNDNNLDNNSKLLSDCENKNVTNCITIKNNNKIEKLLNKADSLTQSDKLSNMTQSSNLSEKDGYETCVDESLSEDSSKIKQKRHSFTTYETENETKPTNQNKVQTTNLCSNENIININNKLNVVDVDVTPTNSKVNILDQLFLDTNQLQTTTTSSSSTITTVAVSEPCLVTESEHHLCLDSKLEDGLKSYDNRDSGGDEFFLVQYPPDTSKEVAKSFSEPNVLEKYHLPFPRRLTFRRCLKEYYNDYEDCLEAYKTYCEQQQQLQQQSFSVKQEMTDEEIFNEIILPFKSRSAPDIMDRSFIMLTYDPGPDRNRRKSAFVTGCQWDDGERGLPMTVIRPIDSEYGTLKGIHVDDMLEKHWGSTHTVEIFREPNKSLGISIVGGKVDLDSSEKPGTDAVLGIFVKNVVPNSPAGSTGQFKTGDRILEVSGIDLRQANHEAAVQAIRNAPNPVKFVIQSLIPWKSHENEDAPNTCLSPFPSPVSIKGKTEAKQLETVLNDEKHDDVVLEIKVPETFIFKDNEEINKTNATELSNETNKTEKVVAAIESYEGSDDDEDDFEDVREMEGRTVSAMGHQIDRASAANLRRSKEEIAADPDKEDDFGYTSNKVKKKYANLGHNILMVQLERSSQGLGLSLAGHKDRNCMAVFVCGLNPNGVAYKTGGIQIGDEILEVNGVVLHGRCHLNASAIIKGLSGPIFKVIILRRKTAIDDIAVKPITQFPVSLAEEAIEEQLSASYPNVRTIPIKKGNQSLGIKIIEGKHAEVGQGIFISEIQEGSSAEKAGLEIGEMILAVNKDTLVGSNYETAANLLKRTEGLVTLVVSNPGRKDQAAQQTSDRTKRSVFENNKSNAISKPSTLKASAPPSRPTTPVPEPPADPATCPIIVGKETTIEIITDNKGLGIFFIGGKDTQISNGIIIVEVYPGGTADKDKRLQPGDQIIDVNGTSLKAVSHQTASLALRQTLPKVKITIYRPITIEYTTIDVDLLKKPGKGMGLSIVARKSGKGVYVSDIINGSIAEVDGRIIKGDLLITVNGQNVENSSGDEVGAILKTVMGRVSLKLHRYKIAR